MKIVLLYPEYPVSFWGFRYSLPFIGKKAVLPPLPLLTVGAFFPTGWEARMVDLNVDILTDADILWADCVFVYSMIAQERSALEVLTRCDRLDRRTVLGGPMVSADPEAFASHADSIFVGEVEVAGSELFRDLSMGIGFLKKRYVASGLCDMRNSPVPWWGMLGKEGIRRYSSLTVQVTRGCPYDCEFCSVTALCGKKVRMKSVGQVLDELNELKRLGWRGSIFFVDDNFIGNKSAAKRLLGAIIGWQKRNGYPFHFYTQASLDLAKDTELLALLAAAGFRRVFVGIETVDSESLRRMGKDQNLVDDLEREVETIQRAGIEVMGGFISGSDGEGREAILALERFIRESGIVTAMVGILQAWPGTRLWERLRSEGRLRANASGNNTDGTIGFVPVGMDEDELREGFNWLLKNLYLDPEKYHERLSVLIGRCRSSVRSGGSVTEGLRALLMSVWQIGVRSSARKWYWKSIAEALLNNRTAIHLAIMHWIFWLHFSTVSRSIVGEK